MTELKTLKDIGTDYFPKDLISFFKDDLKAEAVKWAKFYSKDLEDENAQFIRMWIWKFFNLTEGDIFKADYDEAIKEGKPILK